MKYASHSKEKILAAMAAGEEVWALDTDSDGDDDVLIGTEAEVVFDILAFHEWTEFPDHYELRQLTLDEIEEVE